jgi:choline-sulfatase
MTDQQRWDAMGRVSDWMSTPHIDRIAARGVRFPNAYTNSPICVPARASLMSGRYPHQLGVWKHAAYTAPTSPPTWVRQIRELGYRTSVFGKTHLHPHRGDLRDRLPIMHELGFDDVDEIAGPHAAAQSRSHLTDLWEEAGVLDAFRKDLWDRNSTKRWVARPSPLPLDLYPDVYVGRRASEWLQEVSSDQPWFCWVSFSGPHEPWDAPEPYASRVRPDDTPPPLAIDDYGRRRPKGVLDERLKNKPDVTPDEIAALRANYAGNLLLIDDQVGRVLDVVRERGEFDDTAIVFISDHGEMNGDFGLLYKGNFLNPAVRVPLLASLPGTVDAPRGVTSNAVVELMDVGATLLELANGSPVAPGTGARSVAPLLRRPDGSHREGALAGFDHELMLATQDWKLALNKRGKPYLLFDLQADPNETRNLAGSRPHRDIERRLKEQLRDRVAGA